MNTKRPTLSKLSLQQITRYLTSNSPVTDKNCGKMVKKVDTPPKVPDLFSKKPSISKRKVLPPSNRKLEISVSDVDELIEVKYTSRRISVQDDLQISISTENSSYTPSELHDMSVSSINSCESSEQLLEKSCKQHEFPDDPVVGEVKQLLYKSSRLNVTTTETREISDISEDDVGCCKSSYTYDDCESERTSRSDVHLNHLYPVVQFDSGVRRSDCPPVRQSENISMDDEPVKIVKFPPNIRLPPPHINRCFIQTQSPVKDFPHIPTSPSTTEGLWYTPVKSRDHPPGKVCHSRSAVGDSPWKCNRLPRSLNLSDQDGQMLRTEVSSYRKSQEIIPQKFSKEKTSANFSSPANTRDQEELSYQDPRSDWRKENHQSTSSRRSFEAIPQKLKIETMTRASSLNSITSPEVDSSLDRPYFYHLSPHIVEQQGLWQNNYRADYSFGREEKGNYNVSSPVPPHYNWTPPFVHACPPSYLPIQKADDPLEPHFRGYQLIGDSQLLRFARQILGKYSRSSGNMRFLGLCVSGQTIQELLHKIKAKFYPVGEKVILLIGTNNFLQNHCVDDMTEAWEALMSHLLSHPSRRLLVMTVPPIPKLAGYDSHWEKLTQFNRFIKGFACGVGEDIVKVVDICQLFLAKPKQCREDFFELMYTETKRTDLIHFNYRGLALIRDFLIESDIV